MKTILFTGGGTAGHIIPNLALIDELKATYNCRYVGAGGTEKNLISQTYPNGEVKYYEITARKFKRKLSLSNLLLPFSFIKSVRQAKKVIKEVKPSVIFSKGGFVSLPVVVAGRRCKVPVIAHESDLSLGLANKLSLRFCKKMLTTFAETASRLGKKGMFCGSPVRKSVAQADKQHGLELMNFDGSRKIVTVIGGSSGAATLNDAVYQALPELTAKYDVFLITGKNKLNPLQNRPGFTQREFVNGIFDVIAASDVIISRAGANAICEICTIKKPLLLVPLKKASRGEQIENAAYFAEKNCALVIDEDALTAEALLSKISHALINESAFKQNQAKLSLNGTYKIVEVIKSLAETH